MPVEADAGLAEYGIVPTFSVGDQDCVVDDCFNWNGLDNILPGKANGIVDCIYFNRGVLI